MRDDLMIFGTGARARKVFACATQAGVPVVPFVDENPAARSPVPGVPVLRNDEFDRTKTTTSLFVAIGRADVRRRPMDPHSELGWQLPALVDPHASVSPGAILAQGILVATGAVVENGSVLGRGAIVDVGVIVDHDWRIGDFCHLRPGSLCVAGSEWTT